MNNVFLFFIIHKFEEFSRENEKIVFITFKVQLTYTFRKRLIRHFGTE